MQSLSIAPRRSESLTFSDESRNGEFKKTKAGDIVFCNPYDIHSYYSSNCKGYAVVISKQYCLSFINSNNTLKNYINVSSEKFSNLNIEITKFYNKFKAGNVNKFLLESFAIFYLC